jgi:hypothetical protein
MNVAAVTENLNSIQNALGLVMLRNANNQNQVVVDKLMQGMEEQSAKMMENSVQPHIGGNVDITA